MIRMLVFISLRPFFEQAAQFIFSVPMFVKHFLTAPGQNKDVKAY